MVMVMAKAMAKATMMATAMRTAMVKATTTGMAMAMETETATAMPMMRLMAKVMESLVVMRMGISSRLKGEVCSHLSLAVGGRGNKKAASEMVTIEIG